MTRDGAEEGGNRGTCCERYSSPWASKNFPISMSRESERREFFQFLHRISFSSD